MGENTLREYGGQHYIGAVLACALALLMPVFGTGASLLYFLVPVPVLFFLTAFGWARAAKVFSYAALIAGAVALAAGGMQHLLLSISLVPVGYLLAIGLDRREDVWITGL